MNKTILTGRLTADIDIRQTTSGLAVTSFTLAVKNPRVKDKTESIPCVAWRQQAEFLGRYFKKGDPLEVVGTLTSRNYEDKDGNKRVAVEVVCEEVSFCLTSASKAETSTAPAQISDDFTEILTDEGVPF